MQKAKRGTHRVKRLVGAVLVSLLIMALIPVACGIFLIFLEETKSFFSSSQAAEICDGLKLPPAVEFCARSDRQNAMGLADALYKVYPPDSTPLSKLTALFTLKQRYATERYLSYTLSGSRYVTIYFKQDRVIRYAVQNNEGDDMSRTYPHPPLEY